VEIAVTTPDRDLQRRLPIRNRSSTNTIPPWGAIRVFDTEVDDESGVLRHVVDTPDADSDKMVFFNTEAAVPPEGDGFMQTDFPAVALYNTANGTPGLDERWGSKAGSHLLHKNKTGFFTKPWEDDEQPDDLPDGTIVVVQEVCRS
jgi:hypothetical protein